MREISRDGDDVTVSVSRDELRLLLGALNEALNGAYAVPEDEWEPLVGQPPHAASALLRALLPIVER